MGDGNSNVQICSNEGLPYYINQREMIKKWRKGIDEIEKSSSSEPQGKFQLKPAQSIFG